MLKVGEFAPEFELLNQNGEIRKLSDGYGKWQVVYFYPKDDTPGCTIEACGLRDNFTELNKLAIVYGVSKDSVESHAKFASKHSLPFDLLSDIDGKMIREYQALDAKKFLGKVFEGVLRITYIIDPEGRIAKTYSNVTVSSHAQELMSDLKEMISKKG